MRNVCNRLRHWLLNAHWLLAAGWLLGGWLLLSSLGATADWTTSRGDASSSGYSTDRLPKEPRVLWEFQPENSSFEGTPVIAQGKVWIGDVEGKVFCIDLATGKEVWSVKHANGFVAGPAVRQGRLVLGDYDGRVVCLDAEDGKTLWEADIQQAMASGANFYGDLVLATSEAGQLFAFRLETGELAWEYMTGDQLRSAATVWDRFGLLGGCDGQLHKIDLEAGTSAADGLLLGGPSGSTPSVIGDTAVVPTQSGQVLAFDLKSGEKLWEFADAERSQEIRSSPAIVPGAPGVLEGAALAAVTTRSRRVLALDLRTGKMVWEAVVRKRCDGSPAICDGRVWVGGLDGIVYAFDLATGEQVWSYQLSGQLIASPAVGDGKLVVATDKGTVVCFGAAP